MTYRPVIMEGPAGPEVMIHGKKHLYFAGTGYFDLQADSRVIAAANKASEKFGIGTATSRALAGTNSLLLELEERIAAFFQTEEKRATISSSEEARPSRESGYERS